MISMSKMYLWIVYDMGSLKKKLFKEFDINSASNRTDQCHLILSAFKSSISLIMQCLPIKIK